jgi:hypothetical protein
MRSHSPSRLWLLTFKRRIKIDRSSNEDVSDTISRVFNSSTSSHPVACHLCGGADAEVQFLGVVSFIDDEGSSIRAFADARMLQILYEITPGVLRFELSRELGGFPGRESPGDLSSCAHCN